MRSVRVYDASRQPRDWMDIIQPGQYAVFASRLDGGDPCDADGAATGHDLATCTIVDSLAEAEAFCRERVLPHPHVRFDVFDATGRSKPPLLTVVHPTHERHLEGHGGGRRRNTVIAVILIASAPVLLWIDWNARGLAVVPTILAFNALILAARLLQLNAAYASAERRRLERLSDSGPTAPRDPRPPGA